MATIYETKSGTTHGKKGQGGSNLSQMWPSTDCAGSSPIEAETTGRTAHYTVIDGVAVPDSPEDAEICRQFSAKIAADPRKYNEYVWVEV